MTRNFKKESRELLYKTTSGFGLNYEFGLRLLKRLERRGFDNGRAPKRIVASVCWFIVTYKIKHKKRRSKIRESLIKDLGVSYATMTLHKKVLEDLCGDLAEKEKQK